MPGMSISVTGRQGIWNKRFVAYIVKDVCLFLNFGEGKVEVERKRGIYAVIRKTVP